MALLTVWETGWGFADPYRFLTSTAAAEARSSWTANPAALAAPTTRPLGGSTSTATWTTTITSNDTLGVNDGGLELSATWTASPGNSAMCSNSAYLNYGTPQQELLGTATVNQRVVRQGTTGTLGSNTAAFQELFALTGKRCFHDVQWLHDRHRRYDHGRSSRPRRGWQHHCRRNWDCALRCQRRRVLERSPAQLPGRPRHSQRRDHLE